MSTPEFNVICSVCFNVHAQGALARPIRHGFSIVTRGLGHGHLGAWHTGPCFGASYPHLGTSAKGTQEALKRVRKQIEDLKARQTWLGTDPLLTWIWEPSRFELHQGKTRQVIEVEPGTGADYSNGRPSYDSLHKQATEAAARELAEAQKAEAEYKRVIETWTPEQYAAQPRLPKAVVMHLLAKWKRTEFPVPQCKRFAMRRPIVSLDVLTTDESAITCALCKKHLASRDKERAAAEVRKAKEAASAAKEAARPKRWYVIAQRDDGRWTLAWIEQAVATGKTDGAPVLALSPATYADRSTAFSAAADAARWIKGDPRRIRADRWRNVEGQRYTLRGETLTERASPEDRRPS